MSIDSSSPSVDKMLSGLVRADLALAKRSRDDYPFAFDIEHLCTAVLDRSAGMRLVYTAFDGDHQMMCGQMRRFVLGRGGVPANPDSVLGYKDTVENRVGKRGVLLDDLAILNG